MPKDINADIKQDLIREIHESLGAMTALSAELRSHLTSHSELFVASESTIRPGIQNHSGNPGWRWVIRNDHLDFVAAMAPVAIGLATYATTVADASPVALAITLLTSALAVVRKVGFKTGWLSPDEFAVLMALKQFGPCDSGAIVDALNAFTHPPHETWSTEKVEHLLLKLTAVRVRDGTIEAFAAKSPDGVWGPNGV